MWNKIVCWVYKMCSGEKTEYIGDGMWVII